MIEISDRIAQQLIRWADQNGFTAIIWASFPPTFHSKRDIVNALSNNRTLLMNTKSYIENLPDGPQTYLEHAIVYGNLRDINSTS